MADVDGFDEFYRATAHRVLAFAYSLCTDLPTAQDLTQEAYVRAWQRWRRVGGYDNREAWLRLIVTRLATDRWRWLRVDRGRLEKLSRGPAAAPAPSEDTVLLVRALRRLPLPHRRALAMHYLLDLSIADIATETGASEGTVKSWLSRGRAGLAEVLSETAAQEVNDVH